MKINLDQELYSLKDTREILVKHFKGWTFNAKLREVFKFYPKYEVIKIGQGQGMRYFIKREKLQELIKDIENGELS